MNRKHRWTTARFVLVILLGVLLGELVIGRGKWVYRSIPRSDVNTFLSLEEMIQDGHAQPAVVFFGSSPARGAVLPTVVEEYAGLERGQVLNLAMGGGGPFEALKLYQRNRQRLSRAKLIVLTIDAWQLSTGVHPGQRFRVFADWSELPAYPGAVGYGLIRNRLFRLPEALPYVQVLLKNLLRDDESGRPLEVDPYGRLDLVRLGDDHDPADFQPRAFRFWIGELYKDFNYSDALEGFVRELAGLARADGVQILLVRLPTADGYMPLLRQRPGDPYGQFLERIDRGVASEFDRVQFWENAAETVVANEDYRDWCHFNTAGAKKMSRFLAAWLRQNGHLPGRPASASEKVLPDGPRENPVIR